MQGSGMGLAFFRAERPCASGLSLTGACLPDASGAGGFLCLPGSAEGLCWYPLSEIEKPGSGTEPIHQEHVMCSRFRGSCTSDVKSAVHPEPGFPIPLSGFTAALCVPREIQKNPAARSIPGYCPRFQALSGRHTACPNPRKNLPHPLPPEHIPFAACELICGPANDQIAFEFHLVTGISLPGSHQELDRGSAHLISRHIDRS